MKSELIGTSYQMRNIFDLLLRCAEVDSTVLILGETGVGKEVVAKAIHNHSRNRDLFLPINCGALPKNLLEAELFGYVKGAFTGANSDRKGLFREADGGTIFLDEVGDLSADLQVKLLRVLQDKNVRPLGGGKFYPVNVRIIAATHRNLNEMIKKEKFRKDLFYRLNVISIDIPPLRDRKDDILPLSEYMIRKYAKNKKKHMKVLDQNSQQTLLDYPWPGNVRELENCVEHALAMSRTYHIRPTDLPAQIVNYRKGKARQDSASQANVLISNNSYEEDTNRLSAIYLKPWEIEEKKTIEKALIRYKGNRTRTAKDLGICRATLWRKMRLFSITGI